MKKNLNKILAVALAVTMLALIGVSATLAYLYDTDQAKVNTFAVGKVYVELTEGDVDLQIVPSESDTKRPQVNLEAGSEAAYVFVKVEEKMGSLTGKFSDFVTYSVADGKDAEGNDTATEQAIWTKLEGVDKIWYKAITENDSTSYDILDGDESNANQVSYPATITNAMLAPVQDGEYGQDGTEPSLTFTVFAIQQSGFANVNAAYTELQTHYTDLLTALPTT